MALCRFKLIVKNEFLSSCTRRQLKKKFVKSIFYLEILRNKINISEVTEVVSVVFFCSLVFVPAKPEEYAI